MYYLWYVFERQTNSDETLKKMTTIVFHRNENYFMISESGKPSDYEFLDCRGKLSLKKNGYPTKKNYISLNENGLCDYGEDTRYELTYKGVSKVNPELFWFTAKKIKEGYVVSQDEVINEIGQIGI